MSDVKSTSVTVSWQTVDDADRYTVTLSHATGQDQLGLCPEASRTVSVTASSPSIVVGKAEDDMLKAFTTYSVTVVAESDIWGSSQHSDPVIFTTNQTSNASSVTSLLFIIIYSLFKVHQCLLTM